MALSNLNWAEQTTTIGLRQEKKKNQTALFTPSGTFNPTPQLNARRGARATCAADKGQTNRPSRDVITGKTDSWAEHAQGSFTNTNKAEEHSINVRFVRMRDMQPTY